MKFFVLLAFFFAFLPRATAHQVDSVELELLLTDEQWKLEGLLDIAYMLPGVRGVPDAPPLYKKYVVKYSPEKLKYLTTEAERTMRKILTLKYNGKALPWEIRFPEFEKEPLELTDETGGWALMKAVISVERQPGPGKLEVFWKDDQQSELIVIIEESKDAGLLSISPGMSATLLSVASAVDESDEKGGAITSMPTRRAQAESWLISGFRHVVPLGLDHLLFIIGLFLLAPHWKPLLGQSLLFTLAHSITLAITVFGFITLPSQLVEIMIAASIAWIGIENLIVKKLKPSRLILVFAFGLLHGMGFASVFMEKLGKLTGQQVILPLISFNIGVELAQVCVIIVAFLLLLPIRKYTTQVRYVGSALIALAGLFWMCERILA